ncbi:MAG: CBS domain-containing protein [Blastochloris viridis]|uniref:CBS domain-containing protein n=1 Tax=Blastochloris viridis TaxID=1079 RepID=A0A6N4RD81_BLAVI|nr:MAG: CBS domain-containing protein [Blastochloris viridis]
MFESLRKAFSRVKKAAELSPHIDDLYAAFEEREGDAPLKRHERELLENTLAFSAITADDVGMPRADIVGIPHTADFATVLKAFQDSYHSRLPVMGADLDDIKGLVTLKDVIALLGREQDFDMGKLVRPVTFVPESMPLPRVLHIMKRTRVPLVMVSDEFGGTSGLITLKDIMEEILGDFEDEHEDGKGPGLTSLGNKRYRVQGDYALEDLDSQLNTDLATAYDDVETIGGAVMREAKTVPVKGQTFRLSGGVHVTVTGSDGRRVLSVDVKLED